MEQHNATKVNVADTIKPSGIKEIQPNSLRPHLRIVVTDWQPISSEWLAREDAVRREDRIQRLNWLAERMPSAEYHMYVGGVIAKFLFEEARYCFVYGQFLAVILLGLAFVEHTLASVLYAFYGRNDLQRAGIATLLKEAWKVSFISDEEFEALDRSRSIRNPVSHFRHSHHEDSVEFRAFQEGEDHFAVIERDAYHVMTVIFKLLAKF